MAKERNDKTDVEDRIEKILGLTNQNSEDEDYEEYEDEYESMPIVMDCGEVVDSKYQKDNFQKGINNVSEICGMITALLNTGISEDNAMAVLSMYVEEKLLPKAQNFQLELAKVNGTQQREI